jgi:hypothetical protein
MAKRNPISVRGIELLALIAGAEGGSLMLTQDEGAEAVKAGFATVDTATTDGDTAAVSLTDAGRAALTGNGGVATKFEIEDNVPLPTGTSGNRRGRVAQYPFAMLEVGQSFHVPKTEANPDPANRLASSVTGARDQFAVATGENKDVVVTEYQRGEDGKYVKDAEGKRIATGTRTESRPVKTLVRDFKVASVGADDPKGEGARVWRIA